MDLYGVAGTGVINSVLYYSEIAASILADSPGSLLVRRDRRRDRIRLIWIIGLDVVIIAGNFYLNQKFVVPNYIILAVFLSDAIIDIVNYDVII